MTMRLPQGPLPFETDAGRFFDLFRARVGGGLRVGLAVDDRDLDRATIARFNGLYAPAEAQKAPRVT